MNFSKLVNKNFVRHIYQLFCHGMLTSARSEPDQNLHTSRSGHCQTWARSGNRLPWNFSTRGTNSEDATVRMTKNSTNAEIWTEVGYFSDTPRISRTWKIEQFGIHKHYTEKKMLLNQNHFFPKACIPLIHKNILEDQ